MGRAKSAAAREKELIAMAYDLAEERFRNRTATAQEIVHFLKMGSTKEVLEKEVLTEQKKLVTAKASAVEKQREAQQVYDEVMNSIKRYTGVRDEEEYFDE